MEPDQPILPVVEHLYSAVAWLARAVAELNPGLSMTLADGELDAAREALVAMREKAQGGRDGTE